MERLFDIVLAVRRIPFLIRSDFVLSSFLHRLQANGEELDVLRVKDLLLHLQTLLHFLGLSKLLLQNRNLTSVLTDLLKIFQLFLLFFQ